MASSVFGVCRWQRWQRSHRPVRPAPGASITPSGGHRVRARCAAPGMWWAPSAHSPASPDGRSGAVVAPEPLSCRSVWQRRLLSTSPFTYRPESAPPASVLSVCRRGVRTKRRACWCRPASRPGNEEGWRTRGAPRRPQRVARVTSKAEISSSSINVSLQVGQHHALAQLDIVLGADPHRGLDAQLGPQSLEHTHGRRETMLQVARDSRVGGGMAAHRHRRCAASPIWRTYTKLPQRIAQRIVAPARDARLAPQLAPALHRWRASSRCSARSTIRCVGSSAWVRRGDQGAHMGLRRDAGRRIAAAGRGAWRLHQGWAAHAVRVRAADEEHRLQIRACAIPQRWATLSAQHVGQRDDRHALVMRHVGG